MSRSLVDYEDRVSRTCQRRGGFDPLSMERNEEKKNPNLPEIVNSLGGLRMTIRRTSFFCAVFESRGVGGLLLFVWKMEVQLVGRDQVVRGGEKAVQGMGIYKQVRKKGGKDFLGPCWEIAAARY